MQRLKIILQSKIFLVLSLIILISYSFFFTQVLKYHSKYSPNTTAIEGYILNYNLDGDKLSFLLSGREKVQATYYFKSQEEKEAYQKKFKLGLSVKLDGTLNEPSKNTIPNTFNYKEYLYHQKIFYTFSASNITIIKEPVNALYRIKNAIRKRATNFKIVSPYMQAFILGDKKNIDSEVYSNFQNNGVTHLFAVSGMHVSFLVLALAKLLTKIHLKEKNQNLIIIIFLCFYMFLVGFSASVVRASLLYIFLLINKKTKLNLPSFIVLYILLFLLILINPFYIYDLGFIYSFLTSFGLIIFSEKITGNYLKSLFMTSLIAFLISLPITLLNFYEFNLLTVFNNIIIVPLVSLVLFPLTLITFFIPIIEPILGLGFNLLELLNNFCNNLSIMIVVPKINILFILIYYSLIYLIYHKGFKHCLYLLSLILITQTLPKFDYNSYIYYLDVGQGDSTLIISSNRKDTILIDTGGKITYAKEEWQKRNAEFNLGTNITSFLKSLGISKLDLLICTHGDLDHVGYASTILKEIKVKNVMLNNNHLNSYEHDILQKTGNSLKNKYRGNNLSIQNLNNTIDDDENTSSLVLYTVISRHKFLFMGDASIATEKNILQYYNLSNIAVLKVGHHGSKTSSCPEFINHTTPKYSIISAGRNNRFNHPHQETLTNLQNSQILRTDQEGSIVFKITENKLKVKTYPP